MKIKDIEVGNLFLAPMAGVSDVGFRKICKMFGADLTYVEMINANALLHENRHTKKLLETADNENIKVVQIFGHDPLILVKAVQSPLLEKFDIIDINFGCPAPKIVKNGDGSALLKHLDTIASICKSCTSATKKPVTAKIRIGFDADENIAAEVAKICEENGISAITVHGRTRAQMYSGTVDYETIKKVKQSVSIPVIGNGDVVDAESYKKMLNTGVDGVMIGRGALGRPWIFAELKGKNVEDKFEAIKCHVDTLRKYYTDEELCVTLRKHFLWYIRDIPGAAKYRIMLATTKNLDQSLTLLKDVYYNNK